MNSQLSWQPPMPAPVTKCGECPQLGTFIPNFLQNINFCRKAESDVTLIYEQNKDGITPSCPMYQQQKASLEAASREIANRRGKSVVKVWFDEATKRYKEVK